MKIAVTDEAAAWVAPRDHARPARRERALVAIIAYKLIKGGLWLLFAPTIAVLMQLGIGSEILGWADHLRHHANAWSLELANLLVQVSSRRSLWTLVVALLADGSMTLVEGWALYHGHWWGPWLVIVAMSSLLPFEIVAIVHHAHAGRLLLLVVNLLIVGYLAAKALRDHRQRVDEAR